MLLNKAITMIGPDNVAKGQETVVKGVTKGQKMINEGVSTVLRKGESSDQGWCEVTDAAQVGKEYISAAGTAAAPTPLSQQATVKANAYIPRGITTVGNTPERGIALGGAMTSALPSASNTPAAVSSSSAPAAASASPVVEVEEVIEVIDISGTAQAAEKKTLLSQEQKEKLVRGVTGAMKYYVRGPVKRVVASIAKVGLKTMDLVVATGEKSVENLVKDASSAVVDPVRKKYGKGAAELAQSAVAAVAMVYIDDKCISRKAVVKEATEQVVNDLVVVGESSSSTSTSVTKKKK
ncbi:hypothetical protein BJ742DRAFT_769219 [Cladochytrium replicatum]|nr:hypothetical protein BJ742DRAFT_769219 [Cladochytrium replicatum]